MKLKECTLLSLLVTVVLSIAFPGMAVSQGIVTYHMRVNGKEINNERPFKITYQQGITWINPGRHEQKEKQYIDYNRKAVFKTLSTSGNRFTLMTSFDSLQKATLLKDTATIAGYLCHKAELTIRSNHIEVWYTNKAKLKGSPSPEVAPYLGLVLKIVRNGNYEIYATEVKTMAVPDSLWSAPVPGRMVNDAAFQAKLIQSRYTAIPVFSHQQINFGDSIINPPPYQTNKVYRFSGGTVVAKRIRLPKNFNGNVFASLTQYSTGDAYDRTGCVFVIPVGDSISFLNALQKGIKELPVYQDSEGDKYQGIVTTANYIPPVELIRFFTPFGVGAYNNKVKIAGYHWADSVTYVQDVTDMLPLLSGEVWIGAYIGNYDKNGHTISLNLNYYPPDEDTDTINRRWVAPLFNTLNIMEMSGQNYARFFNHDSLKVRVFVPDSIKDLQLRYISTGHGGWGGGDEFNPKENTILVDGEKVFSYVPWRTDCATYRMDNPSSGNFGNGLSSSDYSRSGWCPGTTTNPVYIPLPGLKPGWHIITIAIPEGKAEGSSFSFWNVSGCLTGNIKR